MAQTHFERLMERERARVLASFVSLPLGDSHRHALVKGMVEGLDKSLELFRQAARLDADEAA